MAFTKKGAMPKGNLVEKFRAKSGRTTDAVLANTGKKVGKKIVKGMSKVKGKY